MDDERGLLGRNIHIPKTCEKCGTASPEYKGVGEYRCSECGFKMYDDFGLVRNYLEAHRGATQAEVSTATGVSRETIRHFLKDDRIEIVEGSGVFLACEICGAAIRSGRYCESCAQAVKMQKDATTKSSNQKSGVQGFVKGQKGESGAKRFTRHF